MIHTEYAHRFAIVTLAARGAQSMLDDPCQMAHVAPDARATATHLLTAANACLIKAVESRPVDTRRADYFVTLSESRLADFTRVLAAATT